jgi:hypothetical protein
MNPGIIKDYSNFNNNKKDKHSDFTSFSNVVARVLSKAYVADGTKPSTEKTCPQCGAQLIYIEGCVTCAMGCGWSKCG